jgi:dephospho-CoA kinase
MSDKIVIGLTGNIATGKSLILRMLQELGATVIDADKLAHQAMRPGTPVYQAIVEEFGKFVVTDNGEIDRTQLGKIVFALPEALVRLEAITHPAVREQILKQIEEASSQVVAIEAVKLFESGLADHCQSTWVITAPTQLQLKRLVERRKMPADQAQQRIKAQSSPEEKAAKASIVIDNSGELVKTWGVVKKQYTALLAAHGTSEEQTKPSSVEIPAPLPTAPPSQIKAEDVSLRRAKPNDLSTIAQVITAGTNNILAPDPSEMMEALFSRAYVVAQAQDKVLGVAGWQAENLIAGLQDIHVMHEDLWESVGVKMLNMIHEEIEKLSCEVVIAFISDQIGPKPVAFLESQGYEQSEANKLGYLWKDAAKEWQPEHTIVLYKKLREHRIMVPM